MKLGKTDSHFYTVVSQDEIFMDIYHTIRTTDINSMMYENKQCSSLDKTYDSLIDEISFQMVCSHKKKTMFDNRCAMNQITNIA
jgi:hypothetical protein